MTTPHPDDLTYAADVVARCRNLRRRHGLELADVAAVCESTPGAVSDFECGDGSRKLGSIQQYAYGCGYRVLWDVDGLGDVYSPEVATMLAVAGRRDEWRQRHSYERAALGALLRAHREAQGLTQKQLGERLGGLHKGNVALMEKLAHDPLLRTVQAHVRALGGTLRVGLVLASPEGAANRIAELCAELADYAVSASRWKVAAPGGPLKGVSEAEAWRIADAHDGPVHRSRAHVLPTGHELLEPWVEVPHPEDSVA